MSNIAESASFQEFIQKRADEIIANDEHCVGLNREILRLEYKLLPLLSPEARDIFLKIDEFTMEFIERVCFLLYR